MEFDWVELGQLSAGTRVGVEFIGMGTATCSFMIKDEFDKFKLGGECDGYTHTMTPGKSLLPLPDEGFWYVVIAGTGEAEVTIVPTEVPATFGGVAASQVPKTTRDLSPGQEPPPLHHKLPELLGALPLLSPAGQRQPNNRPIVPDNLVGRLLTPPPSDAVLPGSLLADINRMNDAARVNASQIIERRLGELEIAQQMGDSLVIEAVLRQVAAAELDYAKIPDYSNVTNLYITESGTNSAEFAYTDMYGASRRAHGGRGQDGMVSIIDQDSVRPKDANTIATYANGNYLGISDHDWTPNSQFVDTETFLKKLGEEGLYTAAGGAGGYLVKSAVRWVGPRLGAWLIEKGLQEALTTKKSAEILAIPKGKRPDPSTYLSPGYIKVQLEKYRGGATRFMTKSNFDRFGIGREDGTSFVFPTSRVDELIRETKGDRRALAKRLALPENFFENQQIIRIDIPNPESAGLRIPSGNEAGASAQWIPGGSLPGGLPEAIIDVNKLSVDGLRKTNFP